MKLTHQHHAKHRSGMTILELTVVILVLLSLIAILFVGARAWKRGSDRAANIMNIRNVQQAVRGHENMYELDPGATLAKVTIFGEEESAAGAGDEKVGYLKEPKHPVKDTTYSFTLTVPEVGVLYMTGLEDDEVYGFKKPEDGDPKEYADW